MSLIQVQKRSSKGGGRVIQIPHGTDNVQIPIIHPPRYSPIYVRFFLDPEGELFRSIHVHKKSYDAFAIPCWQKTSCPICSRVSELDRSWSELFKYRRTEIGFSYAWIYRYSGKMSHIKAWINGPVILYGHKKFLDELARVISDLGKIPNLDILDPDCSSRPFRVETVSEKNDFRISIHHGNKEMPFKIPKNLPPLSQLIFTDKQEPDPKKVQRYLESLDRNYNKNFLRLS